MKILFVNDYREPIGGAEVYMSMVKERLEAEGHTVELFTTDIGRDEYRRRLRTVSLVTMLRRIFDPSTLLRFRTVLRRFRPDVVHIHSYFELSPSFLLLCKSIPTVMTIHDQRIVSAVINSQCHFGKTHGYVCPGCHECVGWKGTLYERLKWLIHAPLVKNIRLFLSPSQFVRDQVAPFMSGANVIHLDNGLELPKAKALPEKRRILFVGRLTKNKGVDVLIQAMPAVIEAIPQSHLMIVGDGEDKEQLQALSRSVAGDSISFTGEVPAREIPSRLYQSDIVVVPSVYPDNQPTVCALAMAAGRVVVVSDIGGLPEMVRDGKDGFVIEPGNVKALSTTLIQILKNPSRMKSIALQAQLSAQRFALPNHISSLLTVYETTRGNKHTV